MIKAEQQETDVVGQLPSSSNIDKISMNSKKKPSFMSKEKIANARTPLFNVDTSIGDTNPHRLSLYRMQSRTLLASAGSQASMSRSFNHQIQSQYDTVPLDSQS